MNVKSLAGEACEHFSTILTHAKYSHGFVILFEGDVEKWDCEFVDKELKVVSEFCFNLMGLSA